RKASGSLRKSTTSCSSFLASSTPAMSLQATSTLSLGLISTGLVLGIDFSVRHATKPKTKRNISEATPCQSVPNCWTFSEKDCLGTAMTVLLATSLDFGAPATDVNLPVGVVFAVV